MNDGAASAGPGVDLSDLSAAGLEALRCTGAYYERRWSRRSQTLFGTSRDEMRDTLAGWPENLSRGNRIAALAVNNTPEHSPHGRRPPPAPDGVSETTGISYEELRTLFERLSPRLRAALDRP